MTLRQLGRLCPILLAIMPTGIGERHSCAQFTGPVIIQAGKPNRAAASLEPPPAQSSAKPAGEVQQPSGPALRIAMEIAPPAQKSTAQKSTASKPSNQKAVDLGAPQTLSRAKPAAAQDLVPPKPTGRPLAPRVSVAAVPRAPLLHDSRPTEPAPSAPAPTEAALTEAAPTEAAPTEAALTEAALTGPALTGPALTGPALTGPALTGPKFDLPPRKAAGGGTIVFSLDAPQVTRPEEIEPPEPQRTDKYEPAIALFGEDANPSASSREHAADGAATLPGPVAPLPHPGAPEMIELKLTEPYWVSDVLRLSTSGQPHLQPLEFDQAIWDALSHSPYVKAVLTVPMISQAKISEASGIFDQTPFIDSIFNDSSDPVGSTLTTGGPNRLNEMRLDNAVGVRTKNRLGGTAELAQNLQLRDNNSVFLSPKEQADAKLLLRLNQPLMRGAGRTYTTSSLRIAEFNAGVSEHEAMRKLQLHAEAIAGAYWNLFAARAIEMQAQRGIERLVYLRNELLKRAEVDGLRSQLLRAEAAIARQEATQARARADIASAEASLRALVNSPDLASGPMMLMPATPPVDEPFVINPMSELQAALAFHPDLLAARDRIKAATTRMKVAENELRPTLNLVMEGYLHGLNGEYGMGDSMADQFARGRPSYAGGLNYQRPYRNIVSKAILRERRLELRQLLLELDNTLLTVTAEVEQAIEAVKYTNIDLEASVKSTMAFDAEVRYLSGRWQNAFVETTQPSLLLDELLNAQNQLIQAENSWARAQAEHMIAFARLHVATGMLLNSMPIPALE